MARIGLLHQRGAFVSSLIFFLLLFRSIAFLAAEISSSDGPITSKLVESLYYLAVDPSPSFTTALGTNVTIFRPQANRLVVLIAAREDDGDAESVDASPPLTSDDESGEEIEEESGGPTISAVSTLAPAPAPGPSAAAAEEASFSVVPFLAESVPTAVALSEVVEEARLILAPSAGTPLARTAAAAFPSAASEPLLLVSVLSSGLRSARVAALVAAWAAQAYPSAGVELVAFGGYEAYRGFNPPFAWAFDQLVQRYYFLDADADALIAQALGDAAKSGGDAPAPAPEAAVDGDAAIASAPPSPDAYASLLPTFTFPSPSPPAVGLFNLSELAASPSPFNLFNFTFPSPSPTFDLFNLSTPAFSLPSLVGGTPASPPPPPPPVVITTASTITYNEAATSTLSASTAKERLRSALATTLTAESVQAATEIPTLPSERPAAVDTGYGNLFSSWTTSSLDGRDLRDALELGGAVPVGAFAPTEGLTALGSYVSTGIEADSSDGASPSSSLPEAILAAEVADGASATEPPVRCPPALCWARPAALRACQAWANATAGVANASAAIGTNTLSSPISLAAADADALPTATLDAADLGVRVALSWDANTQTALLAWRQIEGLESWWNGLDDTLAYGFNLTGSTFAPATAQTAEGASAPVPAPLEAFVDASSNSSSPSDGATVTNAYYADPDAVLASPRVHRGYFSSFAALASANATHPSGQLGAALMELTQDVSPRFVHVSGHGAGGALAAYCALWASNLWPGAFVRLATTGAPRVGDAALAGLFRRTLGRTYGFVADADAVPALPSSNAYVTLRGSVWLTSGAAVAAARPAAASAVSASDNLCEQTYAPDLARNASLLAVPGSALSAAGDATLDEGVVDDLEDAATDLARAQW